MRKALLLVVSIVGLAAAAIAFAAVTRVVAIKPDGFQPVTRTINTGDSVRWRNDDTVNHQVVADNGHFASPVLRPRQT
jgi:plastocyanin